MPQPAKVLKDDRGELLPKMPLKPCPNHFPQSIYDKITEANLPVSLLNELISECEDLASSTEVRNRFDSFCSGRKLLGELVEVPNEEVLGHVKPERDLVYWVSKVLGASEDLIREQIRALAGKGSIEEQRIAEIWFQEEIASAGSGTIMLSKMPTWLFRQAHDLLAAKPECLPWRLGLLRWYEMVMNTGTLAAVPCIGFRIARPLLEELRQPTILDAGYDYAQHVWGAGGVTVPIQPAPSTCMGEGGLPEVVTAPPSLGQIPRPFVFFVAAV